MAYYITNSVAETEELGKKLAATLKSGDFIALYGNLGAGKTAFVRGISSGLNFTGEVSSPTFAIVNEYIGGNIPIYHFDMYRINGWNDLYSIGFFDYLDKPSIIITEWSENIEAAIPTNAISITIETGETDNKRTFNIEGGLI